MSRALRLLAAIVGAVAVIAMGLAWLLSAIDGDVSTLQWNHPWWLLATIAAPIALVLGTIGEDLRVPRLRFGSVAPARSVPRGLRARLRDVPGVLRAGAIALVAIALAGPETIAAAETDERSGIDVMIALDVSGSMRAADLKPTRVEAAKAVVQEFIERRPNDRLGAVVFGPEATLLSPLTFDHGRLAQLVGRVEIGMIGRDGTAIGEGLGLALARLRRSTALSRVVVLLTDGDNNAGRLSPDEAIVIAKKLALCEGDDCPDHCSATSDCPSPHRCEEGVCRREPAKIYTVQMGNGDEVEVQTGTDPFGRPIYGRARYPVNPDLLKKIASETGGEMYVATQTEELRSSMHAILDSLAKTQFEAPTSEVVERFPLVLAPAVALVIVEALLRALVLRRFP